MVLLENVHEKLGYHGFFFLLDFPNINQQKSEQGKSPDSSMSCKTLGESHNPLSISSLTLKWQSWMKEMTSKIPSGSKSLCFSFDQDRGDQSQVFFV